MVVVAVNRVGIDYSVLWNNKEKRKRWRVTPLRHTAARITTQRLLTSMKRNPSKCSSGTANGHDSVVDYVFHVGGMLRTNHTDVAYLLAVVSTIA